MRHDKLLVRLMAESLATPFVMHGARDAVAGGLAPVEQQVKSIEQAVSENPGRAFDLAKTLVESACRAVLGERNIAFNEGDDLPKLFKIDSQHLPFLPPTVSGEARVRDSLKRTLEGLNTAIQGICELRNQCGFASHGSGAPRPPMEAVQVRLAAEAADTMVGFLHRVHWQEQTPPLSPRALCADNPAFNDSVDDTHGMIRSRTDGPPAGHPGCPRSRDLVAVTEILERLGGRHPRRTIQLDRATIKDLGLVEVGGKGRSTLWRRRFEQVAQAAPGWI